MPEFPDRYARAARGAVRFARRLFFNNVEKHSRHSAVDFYPIFPACFGEREQQLLCEPYVGGHSF